MNNSLPLGDLNLETIWNHVHKKELKCDIINTNYE